MCKNTFLHVKNNLVNDRQKNKKKHFSLYSSKEDESRIEGFPSKMK